MPAISYGQQGLMPALESGYLAVSLGVSLPFGGPTGVGGAWLQGQAVGAVGTAAQNEVATLTISGTPTGGTFTPSFTADKVYTLPAQAYNVSLANLQAALETYIFGAGNVVVTGTPGASYVLTFGSLLGNRRIGGLFSATHALTGGTSPNATWARTTRGSAGVFQYDAYSQASNNDVDGFLKYDYLSDPTGARVTDAGVASGQPFNPAIWIEGIFYASELLGLDANAYTLGKLTKKAGGQFVRLI